MTKRKTTPHLKRGPKPKPKPPKRAKGRPEVPLSAHPDRYTVARFDVADTWLRSRLKGSRMRGAAVHGVDVYRQEGKSVPALRKAADRLRTMAKRYRTPDDMKWRRAIAKAVEHTMRGTAVGGEPEQGRVSLIMEYAASVGEAEWARRELLPLIRLKPTRRLIDMTVHDRLEFLALMITMVGWASEVQKWMAAARAASAANHESQQGSPK